MSLYRQTKQQLEFMEERLDNIKIQGHMPQTNTINNSNQLKQKKKPRPMMEAGKRCVFSFVFFCTISMLFGFRYNFHEE